MPEPIEGTAREEPGPPTGDTSAEAGVVLADGSVVGEIQVAIDDPDLS